MAQLKFKKKKDSKINEKDKKEIEPKGKNKVLAIILKESHGLKWLWVRNDADSFTLDKNFYFIYESGMYITGNGIRSCLYLEGVSTPITHANLDREKIEKIVADAQGNKHKIEIVKIKGLKWDSKVIFMLLNRKLADIFLRVPVNTSGLILFIALLILIVLNIVNIYLAGS